MFEPQTLALLGMLVVAWLLQLGLSTLQMKRFHQRSLQLKRTGSDSAIGLAGSMYRRKVYSVLVADEAGTVTAAEFLAGWTVFADLKSVPGLVGMSLDQIEAGEPPPGVSEKVWASLEHAAGFIRSKRASGSIGGSSGGGDMA